MAHKSVRLIFWENTKRPLIFILVSLVAAFFLMNLKGCKDGYDEAQRAPFIIFSDSHTAPVPTTAHYSKVTDLANKIYGNNFDCSQLNANTEDQLTNKNKPLEVERKNEENQKKSITCNTVSEVQYRVFRTKDELIEALNNALLSRRSIQFRADENSLEILRKQKNDIELQEIQAQSDLRNKTQDNGNVNVLDLCPSYSKKQNPQQNKLNAFQNQENNASPACAALFKKYGAVTEKNKIQSSNDLKGEINNHYEQLKKQAYENIDQRQQQVQNNAKQYQLVAQSIYTNLIKKDEQTKKDGFDAIFSKVENRYSEYTLFLDEQKSLNVVYTLLWITALAVIVFALLYVILIPLKHIFFTATSADTLTDKAKELIKVEKASIASSAASRALVATLAAASIGGATLAASPSIGIIGANGTNGENDTHVVSNRNLQGNNKLPAITSKSTTTIDDLAVDISSLQYNIGILAQQINDNSQKVGGTFREGTKIYEGDYNSPVVNPDLITNLENRLSFIEGFIGNNQKPGTIFNILDEAKQALNRTELALNRTELAIGTQKDPKSSQEPLLQSAEKLNEIAGEMSNTINRLNLIASRNLAPRGESLQKLADNINDTAIAINAAAEDIRRNNLGRDGKNIVTQLKTAFSGHHYRVTQGAIEALKRDLPNTLPKTTMELLENSLNKLRNQEKELNKKELLSELPKQLDKKTRNLILRYTRVARY